MFAWYAKGIAYVCLVCLYVAQDAVDKTCSSSLRLGLETPSLLILDLQCAGRFALFFLFLFWMVLFPNRTHPSGVAFLSHQRQSTNPMCASLRICFWLPKLREPFLKRFHLHTNFIVSSACNPPPDGSYICSVASMFEAGFSNDVCFNCNSKHYSGRAGRRKMTRTQQGLTTSHPLCERPGLFA